MVYKITVGTRTYTDEQLLNVDIQLGEDDRANSCQFTILDTKATEIEFWQKWAISAGGIAVPENLLAEPPKAEAQTSNTGPGGSVTSNATEINDLLVGSPWAGTNVLKGSNESIFTQAGYSLRVVRLIKAFEGWFEKPYDDGSGVMTVFWGSTSAEALAASKSNYSPETGNIYLLKGLQKDAPKGLIEGKCKWAINANQLDALISLSYNGGPGAVDDLLKKGNSPDAVARNLLDHYTTASGIPMQGLVNRRKVEVKLFNLPVSSVATPVITAPSSTPTPTPTTQKLGVMQEAPAKTQVGVPPGTKPEDPKAKPEIAPGGTPISIRVDRSDVGVSGVEISDLYLIGLQYQPHGKLQFEGKGIRFKLTQSKAESVVKNANVKQIAQKVGEKHGLQIELQGDLPSDPVKDWVNYGESDYTLLLKAAQSQGLNVRVGVGADRGKVILQAPNQTPTQNKSNAPTTQTKTQELPTAKPNTLKDAVVNPAVKTDLKPAFTLTPQNLTSFSFNDQASSDRITGQGLPPISEVPKVGAQIGKGFRVRCSVTDPKALTLLPGDILETKGLEAASINRQWRIETASPNFHLLKTDLTLYLPVKIKEQVQAAASTPDGVSNPSTGVGVGLPQGVPTTGKFLVFTDVPGQKNSAGTQKCVLRLVENGKVIDEVEAVSGNAGSKAVERAQDSAGSGRPCPPGTYSLGPVEDAGVGKSWGEGLGRYWIDVRGTAPRVAIGLHSDFGSGGGVQGHTMGCICAYSDPLMLKVVGWVNGGADTIIVGYSHLGGGLQSTIPSTQPQTSQINTGGWGSKIAAQALTWVGREFKPNETEQCMNFVRNILQEVGHPLKSKVTANAIDGYPPGFSLANSLAGSDCGTLIYDVGQLSPGDIVTWQNTYGSWPTGTITHVGIAIGNGECVDRSTTGLPVRRRAISSIGTFRVGTQLKV